ncbi:integrase/recombinase, partial [mine drainage metagenome]
MAPSNREVVPRIRTGRLSKEALLADPGIRRWYNNLQRGSLATGDVYLRRLAVLCDKMGTTPQGLAAMAKEGVDDFVMDFVTEEEKVNAAGSYVKHSVVVLRSW